jgi:hypothetical protein
VRRVLRLARAGWRVGNGRARAGAVHAGGGAALARRGAARQRTWWRRRAAGGRRRRRPSGCRAGSRRRRGRSSTRGSARPRRSTCRRRSWVWEVREGFVRKAGGFWLSAAGGGRRHAAAQGMAAAEGTPRFGRARPAPAHPTIASRAPGPSPPPLVLATRKTLGAGGAGCDGAVGRVGVSSCEQQRPGQTARAAPRQGGASGPGQPRRRSGRTPLPNPPPSRILKSSFSGVAASSSG